MSKRKTKPLVERAADYANTLRWRTKDEILVAIFAYEAGYRAALRSERRKKARHE
jgi:hypothetical protein